MRSIVVALLAVAGVLAGGSAAQARTTPRPADFRAAAHREHVPAALLEAIAWTNTHWRMPGRAARDGGWGLMHLSPRQVRRAARHLDRSRRAVRRDARANLRAGAALLAAAAPDPRPRTLAGWRATVARLGGGRAFADQVYAALGHGHSARIAGHRIVLRPHRHANHGAHSSQTVAGEEPGTLWVPANPADYTTANRPFDYRIDKIVIHETEGSYAGTVQWFQNRRAASSAAFVVRSSDGEITQMVREKDVAWHAGNWPYNTTSIGIEHEGYTGDCSWNTDAMYRSSAQLVAELAAKYAIPVDREHIIGHSEVPDPNHEGQYGGVSHHTDPGACWDWDYYLSLVQADLGAIPAPVAPAGRTPGLAGYVQIVDNGTRHRFKHSRHWKKSRRGHQGFFRGYFVTKAKAKADSARFKLLVPTTGDYTLYARWPASRKNSRRVPVAVKTTSGIEWAHVNERKHGGRWRKLGVFELEQGDEWKVLFSRWTKAKGRIVADAVKIKAAP